MYCNVYLKSTPNDNYYICNELQKILIKNNIKVIKIGEAKQHLFLQEDQDFIELVEDVAHHLRVPVRCPKPLFFKKLKYHLSPHLSPYKLGTTEIF